MRFDVYCDESYPDLFTAKEKMHARYLMIGSLWLPTDMREALKEQISGARQKHSILGRGKMDEDIAIVHSVSSRDHRHIHFSW